MEKKPFERKNLAYIFSAGNRPECYKPSEFLSFLVFFNFLACFFNSNNLRYFALAKTRTIFNQHFLANIKFPSLFNRRPVCLRTIMNFCKNIKAS